MNSALIAMSGGVDSSVAALMAVEQGYNCIGGMMKLFDSADTGGKSGEGGCPLSGAKDAETIADILGIPFYIFDYANAFKEQVIDRFVQAYLNGETPNPCIECNRHMKFGYMFKQAKELGMEQVVTGHYARIETEAGGGRYLLKRGLDTSKDQSYVLYTMTQEQLRHTAFPLGGLTKQKVREIALEHGFTNAKKRESQDICFVRDGSYAEFIEHFCGKRIRKGRFIDTDGADLGENKGIIHYTVGQRKGLGLSAATPLYVCSVHPGDNTVVVGTEDKLYAKRLIARGVNLIPTDRLDSAMRVSASIRYKHPGQPAVVRQLDSDTILVEFDFPQRAITKGQAVVMYEGDVVIGGGTITGVEGE